MSSATQALDSDHFRYSHVDYPDADAALAAYTRLYGIGADVVRTAGAFEASVHATRFDKLLLFERRLSGAGHARQARVEADGFDHFTLTHLISGRIDVTADSLAFSLEPGEAMLLDMRRRMSTAAHDAYFLTVSLQRDLVASALGATARLHGRGGGPPPPAGGGGGRPPRPKLWRPAPADEGVCGLLADGEHYQKDIRGQAGLDIRPSLA